MANDHDDQGPAQYSSPPCFMHELDPEFRAPLIRLDRRETLAQGRARAADRGAPCCFGRRANGNVAAHRRRSRRGRSATSPAAWSASTGRSAASRTCAPGWLASTRAAAAPLCPSSSRKASRWSSAPMSPGDRLEKGVWNIPIPAEGDPVLPDIVISPIVGIDPGTLPPGLWRRLLRPHAGGDAVQAAGHRRRLRTAAHRHHLPAAARHSDGPGGDGGFQGLASHFRLHPHRRAVDDLAQAQRTS